MAPRRKKPTLTPAQAAAMAQPPVLQRQNSSNVSNNTQYNRPGPSYPAADVYSSVSRPPYPGPAHNQLQPPPQAPYETSAVVLQRQGSSNLSKTIIALTNHEKYDTLKQSKASNMVIPTHRRKPVPNYAAIIQEYEAATGCAPWNVANGQRWKCSSSWRRGAIKLAPLIAPRRNRAYEDLHEIHKKATFLAMTMLSVPLEWKINFPKINELFVPNSMINRDPLIAGPQHQLTKARVKLAVQHSIQTAFSRLQREVDPHNKQLCGGEIGCVSNRAKIAAEQQVDQTTTTAGDLAAVAAPVVKASNPTEEETASGSSPSTSKDVEIRGSKRRKTIMDSEVSPVPNEDQVDGSETGNEGAGMSLPVEMEKSWPAAEVKLLGLVVGDIRKDIWKKVAAEMKARSSEMNATAKECREMMRKYRKITYPLAWADGSESHREPREE